MNYWSFRITAKSNMIVFIGQVSYHSHWVGSLSYHHPNIGIVKKINPHLKWVPICPQIGNCWSREPQGWPTRGDERGRKLQPLKLRLNMRWVELKWYPFISDSHVILVGSKINVMMNLGGPEEAWRRGEWDNWWRRYRRKWRRKGK